MLCAVARCAVLLLLFGCGSAFAGEAEWRAHLQAGEAAQKRGDPRAAASSFEAALREAEAFGPQDRRLARTLNRIALHQQSQGQLAEAESSHQRALQIHEAVDGPEHSDVASTLNSVGGIYARQGRFAEAQPLFERAISIWEKAYGSEHASVATGLNNLGQLQFRQGRYAEAEPPYQRALAIREKVFGIEHPSLVMSLSNLSTLYFRRGDFVQAEVFARRLLVLREKMHGPNHSDVVKSLYELANVQRAQGRLRDAEELYRRALEIVQSRSVTAGELDAATVRRSLTQLHQAQGRETDAMDMAQAPAQTDPEQRAAAARIWEPERWRHTMRIASEALGRGAADEAEKLCVLAMVYVRDRGLMAIGTYASLLEALKRSDAASVRAKFEKLRDFRQRPASGSVYLGYDPAVELRAYAAALRGLGWNAEAESVDALAEAERHVNLQHAVRGYGIERGWDMRGRCSETGVVITK